MNWIHLLKDNQKKLITDTDPYFKTMTDSKMNSIIKFALMMKSRENSTSMLMKGRKQKMN